MISIPGRIPIHIHPFFWLLIFMIGWLNTADLGEGRAMASAIWGVVILVSILIHEYGHAFTALMFGQEAEISLVALGGVTKRQGPDLSRWKEFFIVLNGPIAGFALFILSYQLLFLIGGGKWPVITYALKVAWEVNLFWTLLNLVPVLPLDGGQLLRILLEGALGFRGLKATLAISIFLAVLIGLYFFSIGQLLIGALFLMMAFESYRAW
jgi:stage IV sporulation protein FB